MKGSLAKVRVLYAPVEVLGGEDRLLMNARHRKRTKYTKKFDSFDARGVMEKYGSEEWGEYLIPEVHLSQ
ncbi:activating signal cointegrator 1 complex subunit 1, partial [Tanacetum coccineum]